MQEIMPRLDSNDAPKSPCAYCGFPLSGDHAEDCPLVHPPQLLVDAAEFERQLQDERLDEETKEQLVDAIATFFESHGAKYQEQYGAALREIARRDADIIVRRESPLVLLSVLQNNTPLKIRFLPDAHGGNEYPNAAALGSGLEGLRIPFERGFAQIESGAIQFVVGFKAPDDMDVHRLSGDAYAHYRGETRTMIRMVEGDVPSDHLRFAIMRVPRHAFPESRMTDDEIDREDAPSIMRLFTFGE